MSLLSHRLPTKSVYFKSLEPLECDICHEPFTPDHSPSRVGCGHIFGIQCLKEWAQSPEPNADTCPMCRRQLFIRDAEFDLPPPLPPYEEEITDLLRQIGKKYYESSSTLERSIIDCSTSFAHVLLDNVMNHLYMRSHFDIFPMPEHDEIFEPVEAARNKVKDSIIRFMRQKVRGNWPNNDPRYEIRKDIQDLEDAVKKEIEDWVIIARIPRRDADHQSEDARDQTPYAHTSLSDRQV